MASFTFHATSRDDTARLGRVLAKCLPIGATVGLIGTLGAGKTHLVKAVAHACGVPGDDVVSPTFVLCREYHGDRDLFHIDAYRIADDDEFLQLGPEEWFDADALTFVEWSDRVTACMPPDRLDIRIIVGDAEMRTFEFLPYGPEFQAAAPGDLRSNPPHEIAPCSPQSHICL
jgi:tRNA threonylcarbamoyladenosine biosynthesis protein TsaE